MKKIIIVLMLSLIILPAIAQDVVPTNISDVVEEPKWEDFCEIGYEQAKVYDENNLINIVSVVKAERTKQTYWAKRRENFETGLTLCRAVHESDKSSCYKDLIDREDQQNKIYTSKRKQYVYFKRPFLNSSRTF